MYIQRHCRPNNSGVSPPPRSSRLAVSRCTRSRGHSEGIRELLEALGRIPISRTAAHLFGGGYGSKEETDVGLALVFCGALGVWRVSQGLTTGFSLPGERPTQPSRPRAPPRPPGEPQMPGRGLNQKTVATCGVFVTSPGETARCCPCTTDPHCYPASALARPTKGRARAKSTSITHTHPT